MIREYDSTGQEKKLSVDEDECAKNYPSYFPLQKMEDGKMG